MSSTQTQAEQNFNLVSFVVCIETKIKNRTHTKFISPPFETAEQAQQFKVQVMDEYPQCFIQENTVYFRSEDDGNRLELLAKIVKVDTSAQLLIKLQQAIYATTEQLTEEQRVQFGNALKHVQQNHDLFQEKISVPDIEGCLEQMVNMFTTQLDEILAAVQKEPVTDFIMQIDSNHFEPRARAGDKLIMRRDAEAWEGAIVAVDAGMQEEVDGQWVNIDYAAALALKSYRAGMNYYAVAVAVMPKRPIQQAEVRA
ncbi:MAG: hypothetical protein ACXV8Q_09800, partial [Methylobacter sp.]